MSRAAVRAIVLTGVTYRRISSTADGMTWQPLDHDGQGPGSWVAGPSGGTMNFYVPNWIDLEPLKIIQVQIAFDSPGITGAHPNVSYVDGFDSQAGSVIGYNIHGTSVGQHFRYEEWRMEPNPDWERITLNIPAFVVIDQVVIDTISLPEPATFTMLAVGAGMVMRRRRRG